MSSCLLYYTYTQHTICYKSGEIRYLWEYYNCWHEIWGSHWCYWRFKFFTDVTLCQCTGSSNVLKDCSASGSRKTQWHIVKLQMTCIFSSTNVKTSHLTFPKICLNCMIVRKYLITQSKEPRSTDNYAPYFYVEQEMVKWHKIRVSTL
jgi:hypothetical protein